MPTLMVRLRSFWRRSVLRNGDQIKWVVCTKCRGAGYLRLDVPFGHPQFGKPQMCECKQAQKKAEQQQALLDLSGIIGLKRFGMASFENFDDQVPRVREAKRLAIAGSSI